MKKKSTVIVFLAMLVCAVACTDTASDNTSANTAVKAPVNEADLEGYWHSAPNFSKGIGTAYHFFRDTYSGEPSRYADYEDGGKEIEYEWKIKENNVLELKSFDGGISKASDYNIEYIAKDTTTHGPALVINNTKFWKMNKPTDVIDGVPVYIDCHENLKVSDYQNKTAFKVENPEGLERIVIHSDADLRDFKIRRIRFNDDLTKSHFEDIIFSREVLTSNQYVEYKTYTATLPFEAITFSSNGTIRAYLIVHTGKPGQTCGYKKADSQ